MLNRTSVSITADFVRLRKMNMRSPQAKALPSNMPVTLAALVGVLWVGIVVGAGYLIVITWQGYREAEDVAARQAKSLARLVGQHARATLDKADLTLADTLDHIAADYFRQVDTLSSPQRSRLEAIMKQHQRRNEGIVSMSLTDAEGYVFANTVGTPPGVSLASRGYFQELKTGPRNTPVISEAIKGRVSNRWGVQVARRVEFPDGSFAGMIVANVGLDEGFVHFYASIGLPSGSFVTMRDHGNRVVVRYPVVEEILGKRIAGSAGTEAVAAGLDEVIVNSRSPVDGIERLVAIRRVDGFPLYASVGLDRRAAFGPWRQAMTINLFMVLAIVAFGAIITLMLRSREMLILDLAVAKEEADRASATKTRFLAAASHDLRQPIQAIDLFVHALRRSGLSETQLQITDRLGKSAASLSEVMNALLDITSIDAGMIEPKTVPVSIYDLLQRVSLELESSAQDRGLFLRVAHSGQRTMVATDPRLLAAILRNIVGNAIKYTERGGVLVGLRQRSDRVVVQIWDTGAGIAPEHVGKVFDEFFQAANEERDRSKGLGLGLAICKRLARVIGAELRLRSRQGRGTVLEISLPRAER